MGPLAVSRKSPKPSTGTGTRSPQRARERASLKYTASASGDVAGPSAATLGRAAPGTPRPAPEHAISGRVVPPSASATLPSATPPSVAVLPVGNAPTSTPSQTFERASGPYMSSLCALSSQPARRRPWPQPLV